MREAVGNSSLLYLVVIFTGIVILFFVGILSYSKAYRVKNRIIEIVEKYGYYDNSENSPVISEINDSLSNMGYTISNTDTCSNTLRNYEEGKAQKIHTTGYKYCIYEIASNGSKYYVVVSYVNFNFPVIGNMINIPVYGETKMLGKSYDY